MGNLTEWGAEVALSWEPAEVSAADLATSGRRLTADTDSEGRRGPRREPEAMDEQSVEVRGFMEGGGWAFLFGTPCSCPPCGRQLLRVAEREAGPAVLLPSGCAVLKMFRSQVLRGFSDALAPALVRVCRLSLSGAKLQIHPNDLPCFLATACSA